MLNSYDSSKQCLLTNAKAALKSPSSAAGGKQVRDAGRPPGTVTQQTCPHCGRDAVIYDISIAHRDSITACSTTEVAARSESRADMTNLLITDVSYRDFHPDGDPTREAREQLTQD